MKYIKNISERVLAAEKRAGIVYEKTDGKLYKWLKRLYVFTLLISVITSLLYIGGRASLLFEIEKQGIEIQGTAAANTVNASIITVGICSAVWLIAAIAVRFKGEIISALLTVTAGTVSCVCLISASRNTAQFNEGINDSFWYRHFVPFLLASLFIIWMVIIKLRQELRFKRAYTNMVNRIYADLHKDDISEEEWESFLKTYDPRAEEEKRRMRKKGLDGYKPIITEEEGGSK